MTNLYSVLINTIRKHHTVFALHSKSMINTYTHTYTHTHTHTYIHARDGQLFNYRNNRDYFIGNNRHRVLFIDKQLS